MLKNKEQALISDYLFWLKKLEFEYFSLYVKT